MNRFFFSSVVAVVTFSVVLCKSECPEDGLKTMVDYVCGTIPRVSQVLNYTTCLALNSFDYQKAIDSCLEQKNNPNLSLIKDPVSYHQFGCNHTRMDDVLDFVCCLVFEQVPPGEDVLISKNTMIKKCVEEAEGVKS